MHVDLKPEVYNWFTKIDAPIPELILSILLPEKQVLWESLQINTYNVKTNLVYPLSYKT